MSGPKRNPDKLNTIGVVVVGICGAVLVYVSIVALQAFYMGDTSEIQTMADYGGQDATHKSIRTTQISNITEFGPNPPDKGGQTYRINIDHAIKLVAAEAKQDPGNLVPTQGRSAKATIQPVFGRPKMAPAAAPDAASPPAGGAQPPADATGSTGAQLTPTGGQGPGGGQTAGQGPTPEAKGPPSGAGAGVNPTGGQTPSNTQRNREQGTGTTRRPGSEPKAPGAGSAPAPKGGNPPTPAPKATGSAASSPTKGNGR